LQVPLPGDRISSLRKDEHANSQQTLRRKVWCSRIAHASGCWTTPFARVGQKPRRVWMPINDLLGFLDTFRLTDSWPVFV